MALPRTSQLSPLPDLRKYRDNPLALQKAFWPQYTFYQEQRDIVRSVWENRYTWAPAAQKMGKDFVAGFIPVAFFLTRNPCRVVVTSAKEGHLDVVFAEINKFINTCKYPLLAKEGGPLLVKYHSIEKLVGGKKCPTSYIKGMVAADDSIAAMGGHHVATWDETPHTLFLGDECSSMNSEYEEKARPWAKRIFFIGNTWECDNIWRKGVDKGDVPYEDPTRKGMYSKVIRIPADRSPNVRLAQAEQRAGLPISRKVLIPGLKTWDEYQDDLKFCDPIVQSVCLHAQFYVGKELRLFPQEWLTHARRLAIKYRGRKRRAKAIGIDPAEGGDSTCFCVVDECGVIELVSLKTPDTSVIRGHLIALGMKYSVPPECWVFDRGGGGKQIADEMRRPENGGYEVRTVGFGEAPTHHPRPETVQYTTRVDDMELRHTYESRRVEMYSRLSEAMNPIRGQGNENALGFSIPGDYTKLFDQLKHFPKLYGREGQLRLPPKRKKDPKSKEVCLVDLIGHSPDEADSLALAYYGMVEDPLLIEAGGIAL